MKKAIVFGAGHGIGLSIVKILIDSGYSKVYATYRNSEKSKLAELMSPSLTVIKLNPLKESELAYFCNGLRDSFDLIINTIGVLAGGDGLPEKSTKNLDLKKMIETFEVNTMITPLIAKYLKRKINTSGDFVTLSAMVGSIADNKIGGWYSYRASKAALNMFIKTLSIEFSNLRKEIKIIAIHPGTTRTGLSNNYLSGIKHKIWEPDESAKNILNVVAENKRTGVFLNWDGSIISW